MKLTASIIEEILPRVKEHVASLDHPACAVVPGAPMMDPKRILDLPGGVRVIFSRFYSEQVGTYRQISMTLWDDASGARVPFQEDEIAAARTLFEAVIGGRKLDRFGLITGFMIVGVWK